MSLPMKQEQSHRHREEIGGYQGAGAGGERVKVRSPHLKATVLSYVI